MTDPHFISIYKYTKSKLVLGPPTFPTKVTPNTHDVEGAYERRLWNILNIR